MLTPLGKKDCWHLTSRETVAPGEVWEGKLRSEYIASPINGSIDRLGTDEALLAVAAGMVGGGANLQQAGYVALSAAILESQQLGHHPLDGHALRELLGTRPEIND